MSGNGNVAWRLPGKDGLTICGTNPTESGGVKWSFLSMPLLFHPKTWKRRNSMTPTWRGIAVEVATAYEKRFNAQVMQTFHAPNSPGSAGLTDWPGFDLLSRRPSAAGNPQKELAIEVKGRRGYGGIELKDNEWANACNLRGKYWLYVVFDCATAHPRLVRVRDPFGKLLAKTRESTAYTITESQILDAAE